MSHTHYNNNNNNISYGLISSGVVKRMVGGRENRIGMRKEKKGRPNV